MDFIYAIAHFFQAGGAWMYPIATLLLLGIVISIERYFYLRRSNADNQALWAKMVPLMASGKHREAEDLARDSDTAIGKVMSYGFAHSRNNKNRAEVEMAVEEALMEVTSLLEKRTHYLAVFANVATLLGLLGTINGMIDAFAAIASMTLSEKTDLLAEAISEALNCTAFGLFTAVPLLLIHAWLTTKTGDLVDSLEMASVKFLNSLGLQSA